MGLMSVFIPLVYLASGPYRKGELRRITLHVLLTLINNESISAIFLLL